MRDAPRRTEGDRPRPRHGLAALLVACAGALSGCATTESPPLVAAPRPLGRGIPAFEAPRSVEAPVARSPLPEPAGTVTLREALVAALVGSPDLAAASWEVRAAEARALQAGLPTNPELELETEEFAGSGERSGFGSAEYSLSLSQEILLGGKLARRRDLADLEGLLAGWDYETARLDALTATTRAFIAALAAQERVALHEDSVRVGEEMLRAARARVASGKAPRLEEDRAAVALALQRLQRDRQARELRVRMRSLAATWGSRGDAVAAVAGPLYETRQVPPAGLLVRVLEQNPELARGPVEERLERAQVEAERAERYADVTVTGGVSHFREDGGDAFMVGLALPLPIFDRNTSGIRSALAVQRRGAAARRAVALRVRTAFFEAYEALAVSAAEAGTLKDAILPLAESAFAASTEGFRQGKLGYVEVLDAQRTLFETREQLIEALAAYHTAVADVERLVGQSLDTVGPAAGRDGPPADPVEPAGGPRPDAAQDTPGEER